MYMPDQSMYWVPQTKFDFAKCTAPKDGGCPHGTTIVHKDMKEVVCCPVTSLSTLDTYVPFSRKLFTSNGNGLHRHATK